jgi:hypothetical protein
VTIVVVIVVVLPIVTVSTTLVARVVPVEKAGADGGPDAKQPNEAQHV